MVKILFLFSVLFLICANFSFFKENSFAEGRVGIASMLRRGIIIHSSFSIHGELVPGPLLIPKSVNAQVLYNKMALHLHITYSHPPIHFKSSLDYL